MANEIDTLLKLSRRGMVAFAARCARRVLVLAQTAASEYAVLQAEWYASDGFYINISVADADTDVQADANDADAAAQAAASAAAAAFDSQAVASAAASAVHAFASAVSNSRVATSAASSDYQLLLKRTGHQAGEHGDPIDMSENGPLGPLWPDGEPDWYREARLKREDVAAEPEQIPAPDEGGLSELVIEIDVPEGVSEKELIAKAKEVALLADKYHRSLGGHGLTATDIELYEDARVLAGGPNG